VSAATPLYASPCRPGPSRLDSIAEVARLLGFDLMLWQHLVIERATVTVNPYREVVVSTPRQIGKSLLMALVIIDRMLAQPDQFVLFGAQSRMTARGKLLDGWWPMIARSELADRFTIARGAGFEALRCDNGSLLRLLSTEESSGHGESVDLVVIDECWSLDARVEQAVRPATIRRPGAQMWLCSTAGTDRSVWWRSKVDTGREIASRAAEGAAMAFYEWAAPEGADVTDEAVWWACHPALAEGHVPIELIRADAVAMPAPEFARAYCNLWTSDLSEGGWHVIDEDAWKRARR
jgi:phage terminase large subunit-like protein